MHCYFLISRFSSTVYYVVEIDGPISQECKPLPIVEADAVIAVPLAPPLPAATAPTIPTFLGKFSTGLCDCINICCSGMWWNGYCCQCILWGQIATRLKLTMCGNRGRDDDSYRRTCGWLVGLWISMWVLAVIILIFGLPYCRDEYEYNMYEFQYEPKCEPLVPVLGWICSIIMVAVGIYILVFLIRTRNFFRRHYSIPASCCGGDGCCDDCCCVYFCSCCSVIQMLRHTHDERLYKYQCCNNTGLPPDAPDII